MGIDRIKQKFSQIKKEGRTGLILFLTVGYPDIQTTRELIPALVEAGADAIELGVPFSDPLADGATIQASSFHALRQGTSIRDCLKTVEDLRQEVPETPLILMGYYNPIFQFGLTDFCNTAHSVGVDGLIVPDLPIEEAEPLHDQCRPKGIHLVPLLAPTSTEDRIKTICAIASGFIYCLTVTGVTGTRDSLPTDMDQLVNRVRRHTDLPIGVGFGISTREHLEAVGRIADAAIVGSALIRAIQDSSRSQIIERATQFVRELRGTSPGLSTSKEDC